jgi:hypothetical protein
MTPIQLKTKVIRRFRFNSRSLRRASFWKPEFFLKQKSQSARTHLACSSTQGIRVSR